MVVFELVKLDELYQINPYIIYFFSSKKILTNPQFIC